MCSLLRPRRNEWFVSSPNVSDSTMGGSPSSRALRDNRPGRGPVAIRCPDRRDLLGDVDADRAPCDTTAAADTARDIELVVPGGELVRKPLPIAPADRRAKVAAVNTSKLRVEAA